MDADFNNDIPAKTDKATSHDTNSHDRSYEARAHEVLGSERNISRLGSPVELAAGNRHVRYYFFPTWRSRIIMLLWFFILCAGVIWLCREFPIFVLTGKLFDIGNVTWYLSLPLPVLIPGFVLGKVLLYIYNSRFIIDERGVEAQIGLVSFNLRQPRLRYEDIRGIEPQQTLWERILGIGSVLIGSAMTQNVEITMAGVSNPRAIQLLISGERDRRLKKMLQSTATSGKRAVVAAELVGD